MPQDWTSQVKSIIEEVIKKPVDDSEQNLFVAGLIDSLSMVNVLVSVEEKLGVSLDILDFTRREEFTVQHISMLVLSAKKKAGALPENND